MKDWKWELRRSRETAIKASERARKSTSASPEPGKVSFWTRLRRRRSEEVLTATASQIAEKTEIKKSGTWSNLVVGSFLVRFGRKGSQDVIGDGIVGGSTSVSSEVYTEETSGIV